MSPESIKLPYPLAIGLEQRKRLEIAGLKFSQRREQGYTKLDMPYELGSEDLAALSAIDLIAVTSVLYKTRLEPLINEAEHIFLLRRQVSVYNKDGFLYPTQERPFTWPLRKLISGELAHQQAALAEFGINQVKVGLEMEFSCVEDAISSFDHAQVVQKQALQHLQAQADVCTDQEEKQYFEAKIEVIKSFNAREILMYDLIELDSRTQGIFEPLFGTQRDGDGYYDGKGVLELKFQPVSPELALQHYQTVLFVLYEKLAYYGLELQFSPSFHINVSFWDNDGNIFCDTHPLFRSKGWQLAEGITAVFFDALVVLISQYEALAEELIPFNLTTSRQNLLRFSSGRIEVRPSVHEEQQDIGAIIALLLAGAVDGMRFAGTSNRLPAQEVSSPVVHHESGVLKVTSHVINNSIILPNGCLQIPEHYFREHFDTIMYELGLSDVEPSSNALFALLKMFSGEDEFYQPVLGFFKAIRVDSSGGGGHTLVFPTNMDQSFQFQTPPINMDKIPEDLQQRLIAGEVIDRAILSENLRPGDRLPVPARVHQINLDLLQQKITLKGVQSKFEVKGYNPNDFSNVTYTPVDWNTPSWSKYVRLMTSEHLATVLSSPFFTTLCQVVRDHLRNPIEQPTNVVSKTQVKEILWFKIRDKQFVKKKLNKIFQQSYKKNGLIEGKNFMTNYYSMQFLEVGNGDHFCTMLHEVLEEVISTQDNCFWYSSHVSCSNGKDEVFLELEVELFKLLKAKTRKRQQNKKKV